MKNREFPIEEVLIEAFPYVRELRDAKIVVKMGGHAIVDREILKKAVQDVVFLRLVGAKPMIVHGGGPEITEKMEKFGKKPKFIDGLRITDEETLEIAEMVLVGKINTNIVRYIVKHGGKGIGLSGEDGLLLTAKKKDKIMRDGKEKKVDLGWVGETEAVDTGILNMCIENGYIPVISPIAIDLTGDHFNINADTVAGDIASAMRAKKLIFLTDVPGILDNRGEVISNISLDEGKSLVNDRIIGGGMIPKLESSIKCIESSVEKVHIIDGSKPHALLLELFTDRGVGTMICR